MCSFLVVLKAPNQNVCFIPEDHQKEIESPTEGLEPSTTRLRAWRSTD